MAMHSNLKALQVYYQKALLRWHVTVMKHGIEHNDGKYKYPRSYTNPVTWAREVLVGIPGGLVIDNQSVEDYKAIGEINMSHVQDLTLMVKQAGGVATLSLVERKLGGETLVIIPADLREWPESWPVLDNTRMPQVLREWGWRELCREGLCLTMQ